MSFKSPYRMFPWLRTSIESALGNIPLPPFDFDLGALTFLAGMAKRDGGAFAAAPIVQGKWDGTGTPDVLTFGRGAQVFENFYANIDSTQGTLSFWITPEWDGDDGVLHIFSDASWDSLIVAKSSSNLLYAYVGTQNIWGPSTAGWIAGTTYHVVFRFDTKKPIDGTNYGCFSVNGSHTFGGTTQPSPSDPGDPIFVGALSNSSAPANAIISGLRIDRRVWYEDTAGTGEPYYFDASGYIDEIAAAYDAGAGADPALVEASWDGCMCLPTDSAVGALTGGNGNAWSHPHASALLNNTWLEDTFGPNQQDVVSFNGTTTSINCGSAAALDDIGDGAVFTVDGWFKSTGGNADSIISKGNHGSGGWLVFIDGANALGLRVDLATTDVGAFFPIVSFVGDGKWHYYRAYYDDATKTGRISVDGEWGNTDVGVGLWQTDAANDLVIGSRFDLSWEWEGDLGWQRISDNDRGGGAAGTDFIPPRTMPAADGNTIEQWGLDDGTGATAAATVTSPGNDGTITDGTWTEKFEFTGTPLELTSLEFDGSATTVNFGNGANINNLPTSANGMTAEGWFRLDGWGEGEGGRLYSKRVFPADTGWSLTFAGSGNMRIRLQYDNTDINTLYSHPLPDSRWHHYALTYYETASGGDNRARLWIDGVLVSTSSQAVGNYQADAADDLRIGSQSNGTFTIDGGLGWHRISDTVRYTSNFVPPSRVNPPGNDANAQLLVNMDDGAGATATDTSGNGYDGTITMGAGQWRNTFAQEYDSPGSRTYAWGYSIGSDAPSDGVEQHIAVTAGDDWVLRIPVRYEDATAWAQILVYDETGAAAVSTFDGPPLTGLHDGGDDQAAMTDTGNVFPASLIDGEIYNITDGSSGTITAVGGTNQDTITAALSGGTGDDWDDNDVYMIVPPPNWVWCEPFCVEAPAGCTEMSVQLLNAAGDGVLLWQQAEVQTNLVTGDPSIEDNNASNPFITTGWANVLLDAGDTEFEAVIVHSGAGALEWNVGAIWGEYVELQITLADDKFFSYGLQHRGDGTDALRLITTNAALHYSLADNSHTPDTDAVWLLSNDMRRATGANPTLIINPSDGAPSGDRFHDDVFAIECDDVSLTVTPASEANSLESGGICIDGRDQATQVPAVGILRATQGRIRFRWRPRHSAAQAVAFGETGITTDIFDGRAPIANYIALYWAAVNTVQLIVFDGGVLGIVWNAAGLVDPDTEYLVEIRYYPARADLLIDGVVVATGAGGIDFGADIITLANYGHNNVNADQTDAVFSAP